VQALSLSLEEWLAIERELYSRSLSEFVKAAWHVVEPSQPYVHGWHIDCVCAHLEAVTDGKITRLLVNIPPGTMKSLLIGVFWPAWEWGAKGLASTRYVTASHNQELAVRDTMKMRRLISSDWYQSRWPILLAKDQNEKTKFENASTGFRHSMAMKGLTGSRGDRVIIDDPHSIEGALSDAERETTLRVFTETVPSRLSNPASSAIVVVMQRIHEHDVSGLILSDADKLGYVHLMLPMEYEPERGCDSPYYPDKRTNDGELLFPERFPAEVVERDKKIMMIKAGSQAVAGQFQQRPAARGGNIIRGEWFGRYTVQPQIQYTMIFADTAQKTAERHDYSVFQCWGVGHDSKLYLIDQIRGKWEAPDLKRRAEDFWSKHRNSRKMAVEDKASGTGLIQDIRKDAKIPIFPIQRNKDKLSRVMDAVGRIEAGYVLLPSGEVWVSDFIAECESFTADNSHAHDDQIDPMCDAIMWMLAHPVKEQPKVEPLPSVNHFHRM
jgi:predicted phage terminase large subunit-like protein